MLEREKTSMADVATLQPQIAELLERAGAHPRGKRFDCPDCGSRQTVAVNEAKGVFCCHHAGCDFRGGLGTLRKRLGIEREWLPLAEYTRQRKARWQAETQARQFLAACRTERLKVCEELRELDTLEQAAHALGPESETAWNALEMVYRQRPRFEETAALFSEGSIQDRRASLEAGLAQQ